MKKIIFTIALISGLQLSLTASAQQTEKVTLRVPNFARPLVEKWVAEYQKTNSGVDFQFVSGKSQTSDNTISLTTQSRTARHHESIRGSGIDRFTPFECEKAEAAVLCQGRAG